jgi:branched-chain amino acid transport system substrate-binding protein
MGKDGKIQPVAIVKNGVSTPFSAAAPAPAGSTPPAGTVKPDGTPASAPAAPATDEKKGEAKPAENKK